MKEKKLHPYFVQSDKEIISGLIKYLQHANISDFSDISKQLNKLKIETLADLWQYAKGKNSSDTLAIYLEIIFKRIKQLESCQLQSFCSSSQVGYYLCDKLSGQEQEQLYGIFLNTKNKIIAEKLIFQGTLNKATVHPRDIFRWGIVYNCASFILVHNHPSGDSMPSQQDIEITKKIKAASEFMGINFIDHFIVTDKNYLSLKEANLL
ncbi:MAG: DNA repair protein RadC [Lactobacillus sp.]|nr:DNA repair protein RadC [Lactobacillus sp.]